MKKMNNIQKYEEVGEKNHMKSKLLRYPSLTKFCQPSFNTYLYEFTYKYIILVNWLFYIQFFYHDRILYSLLLLYYLFPPHKLFLSAIPSHNQRKQLSMYFPELSPCIYNYFHTYEHIGVSLAIFKQNSCFSALLYHHLSIHMVYSSVNIFEYINIIFSSHNF